MGDIAENLDGVRGQIAEAAKKSGRAIEEIELVAISKTHEAEKVRAAFDAGQQVFGESRVQEARAKIPLLPSAARWHFVGRLQRNKVRHALPLFELFHSVDSIELARDMNRVADEEGLRPRVLLEVNVAGEGSKIDGNDGRFHGRDRGRRYARPRRNRDLRPAHAPAPTLSGRVRVSRLNRVQGNWKASTSAIPVAEPLPETTPL